MIPGVGDNWQHGGLAHLEGLLLSGLKGESPSVAWILAYFWTEIVQSLECQWDQI